MSATGVALSVVIVAGCFLRLIYLIVEAASRRAAERMLDDFLAKWPRGCPICAYDRGARGNGVYFGPPGQHHCPEAR